jgi:uncharacterized membrane protein YfcA
MTPAATWAVLGILLVASTMLSALGFGMGMIAMPLLGLLIDVKEATPLIGLLAMVMSVLVIARDWRSVEWRSIRWLAVGRNLGIPLGVYLLASVPQGPIVKALGCLVVLFALYRLLWKGPPPIRPNVAWGLSASFLSGALGAAFSIGGPPIIAYASLHDWDPPTFRATMHGLGVISGVLTLIGHGVAGLWTPDVVRLFAYGLPAMLLGLLLGRSVNQVLNQAWFHTAVYAVLLILGVLLLAT